MSSLFERQIHQNIIYTSNRRHSIHTKNLARASKTYLQPGVVTVDDILHAKQSSDIRDGHHVGYVAYQLFVT